MKEVGDKPAGNPTQAPSLGGKNEKNWETNEKNWETNERTWETNEKKLQTN